MSIRNLFDGDTPYSVFAEKPKKIRDDGESLENVSVTWKNRNRSIPQVDFSKPENFARYGSAEKYYRDAITRIYEDYPYDGSSKEKQQYTYESTYIDLWMLDNKYPRTNGYIQLSANGWGASTTAPTVATSFYGEPTTKEYINFFGGPHTASEGMFGKRISSTFEDSNKYDTDIYDNAGYEGTGTREGNLKTNFDNGVTVEFWFKKENFDNTKTEKEVIFDLWNNTTSSAASYGRILLQVTGTSGTSPFILTVQSGATAPFEEVSFGTTLTTSSFDTFSHYAFRIYNDDASIKTDFYINGELAETEARSPNLGEITGALQANIGALTSPAVVSSTEYADKGWGKLSGSLDEFRFWKSKRTSQEIGREWFTQVYGGTNTDISNADLGVYYKFNEGITGINTIDSSVLDYSGRVTNGTWTGYTVNSRNTSSAMVEANAASSEFLDPIIYSEHPAVQALVSEMASSGSYHDYQNTTSLYDSFPNWITQADSDQDGSLKDLTQVMSSYLDTLFLQIGEVNKLKNISYVSSSNKEIPFSDELLDNVGFLTPEIFADASVLNQISSRDEGKEFLENLFETKNLIYKNIYNNVVDIYKSKGTEKSFRNVMRCYGIDEKLIKINAYANNLTYDLRENYSFATSKKRFVDFYRPDAFYSTIYQQTSSIVPDSVSFISASNSDLEDYTSFTAEIEVLFPKKKVSENNVYYPTPFQTSSIFGFHTADDTDPTNFTWGSPDYDLQVYAIRPDLNGNLSDGRLMLTSSYYGIELVSDTVKDLYNNGKWNISARVSPEKQQSNLVSGSSNTDYLVELYAVNMVMDTVQNEVSLSTTVTTDGDKYLNKPKRIYVGAHRPNFTGSSVIHGSDIKVSNFRYWTSYLSDNTIKSHARDTDNFGQESPYQNTYNFVTSLDNREIPQMETLALHWRFDQITGSDNGSGSPTTADAGFGVTDYSSGSTEIASRYGWLGNVIGKQHTGRADFLYPEDLSVINVEFIPAGRQVAPEVVNSYDMVKVFNIEDEQLFTKQSRPINFFYSIEKSMYATITEEIINYFATILDFNSLIGDPVNRYRQEYKSLGKLRSLFFENIENTPDIERYVEYYKWVDDSLGQMLMELFPASAITQDGIRTMVESHVLERNKYWNKYPTVDMKKEDPETGIRGINELLYDWKTGHRPIAGSEREACFYWKERASREDPPLATGIAGVDSAKEQILSVTLSALTRKYSTPLRMGVKREELVSSGLTSNNNNIRQNFKKSVKFGSTDGLLIPIEGGGSPPDCVDGITPISKIKIPYKIQNQLDSDPYMSGPGDLFAPFISVLTGDLYVNGVFVNSGYNKKINEEFQPAFSIENLHIDSYIDSEVPLQGPFTEKYVGGNQHRHVPLNTGTDNPLNRPEAWVMDFQGLYSDLKVIHQPVSHPRATHYRDLTAKRLLNIKNIKDSTATYGLGNYSKDYEIVQTVSRTKNNSAFVKAGGFSVEEIPSPFVAGMTDYTKPQRGRTEYVFVNRFSSPGSPDTAGDSDGGPALDPEAAEFSPYNNINYRNTPVRDINNLLLASHVNQFGFYSDTFDIGNGPSVVNSLNYAGTGSMYQVNRNTIRQMKDSGSTTVTASVYDNFYVQHAIPRSDLQYSWIAASAMSYGTFGYLPYDGTGDLITFSSASDFVSVIYDVVGPTAPIPRFGADASELPDETINYTASYYVPTVYNWLNYNVYEPQEYINSFIGYNQSGLDVSSYLNDSLISSGLFFGDGKASLLNAILLKRNGPYQHPSWKQTRGHENPLVRKWNSSNRTAYNLTNGDFIIRKDSPVISKYKPLKHILKTAVQEIGYSTIENTKINSSYGNQKTLFSNRLISSDLNITNENVKTSYDVIKEFYVKGSFDEISNPIQGIGYFAYQEQVYPTAQNSYSSRNRARHEYENDFWKNSRVERTALGKTKFGGSNSQGYVVSQSAWALDTSEQFGTGLSTYIAESASMGAAGELQNDYTFAYRLIGGVSGDTGSLQPAPIYARKHTLGSCLSVIDPWAINPWFLTKAGCSSPPSGQRWIYNTILEDVHYLSAEEMPGTTSWPGSSQFNDLGYVSIFGGNAKFEAHEQSGYMEDGVFVSSPSTPFYDKYEQYVHNMRLKNKDMSLVPEFRISDHVNKYLEDADGFLAQNTASFSIFGVNVNNTQVVDYADTAGQGDPYDVQISEITPRNSSEDEFYRIYSFSDFMENFKIVSDDHDDFDMPKNLTLYCKALMKFLPYDGFYPAERTLQIAKKFTEVYEDKIAGTEGSDASSEILKMRPILAPLFSPGILYNTIKSGIAVDYPVYTGSFTTVQYFNNSGTVTPPAPEDYSDYYAIGPATSDSGRWHYRVPFESILDPTLLKDIKFYDMEPHPSCSLNSIYSTIIAESTRNDDYKLAISNFLGESTKFFLKGEELTSLDSKQESDFSPVNAGVSYAMRVKIRRSMTGVKREISDWTTPQEYYSDNSGLNFVGDVENNYRMATLNMYSRPSAFGPPMAGTGSFSGSIRTPEFRGIFGGPDPTCGSATLDAPRYGLWNRQEVTDALYGYNVTHTPPYYSGESWIDLIYTPASGGIPSLEDIQANSEQICWRIDGLDPDTWPSGDTGAAAYPMHSASVNNYAMQLTSSINLMGKKFVQSEVDPATNNPAWAIQTKFETPVLNFGPFGKADYSNSIPFYRYLTGLTLPTTGSTPWTGVGGQTTTPIGIWHQFGTIPEKDQGIFLEVGPIPEDWLDKRATQSDISAKYLNINRSRSLAEIVGFAGKNSSQSKKIGNISEEKTVYEAIVAVPFYTELAADIAKGKSSARVQRKFFDIPTVGSFHTSIPLQERSPLAMFGADASQDIINMALLVKDKYVFPPQFDFFRNLGAKPVSMYIFEFDHTFNKFDLSCMWQNIAPRFGTEFKEATSSITHPLLTTELLDNEDLKKKVKWMVFKVKQRAEADYWNNILVSPPKEATTSEFSYNWPYDYFSMVEFAKMDAEISYGTIPNATLKTQSPISKNTLPPDPTTDIPSANSLSSTESKQQKSFQEGQTAALVQANKLKLETE